MPLIRRGNCALEYLAAGNKTLADGSPAPVITSFVAMTKMGQVTPESGQKEYYTICISMRGWGQSRIDAEDPIEFMKAEHFVPDLLAVLDAEGVQETALVCHSYGGFVGVLSAYTVPERVTALVMVSTKFGLKFADEAEEQMRSDFEREAAESRCMFPNFDAKGCLEQIRSRLSDERLRALPSIDPKERVMSYKKWFGTHVMNLRFQIGQMNHQLNEMGLLSDPAKLRIMTDPVEELGVDAPTFRARFSGKVHFMVPLDDAAVPWEFCALMAERLGGSFEEFDPGMGDHSIMFFSPDECNKRIRAALES